ncbi:plasma membrane iron permease [Phlyctema vagabunda]|uniref:Plasma membrane iron permease n=1 Tax=Phlyctema vagabunda TaxID=108571 RepID=A0ABR4PDI7_9HELO
MTVQVFAVPVFFIVFRETLETSIIVSVLLAFLKQTLDGPGGDHGVYKRLVKQVWMGTAIGLLCCLIIGGAIIGAFYATGKDRWANTEYYWEGSFAIFASLIITVVGAALLRVSKMQEKWRVKLAKAMEANAATGTKQTRSVAFGRWCEKNAMFILPFITVLREGLEAVVFVAGVSFSAPATAVPLPVFCGLLCGGGVGYFIYRQVLCSCKLQLFLVISTCLLYLVAAGLFSRGVWFFEAQKWNDAIGGDAAETGSGPGSYDIDNSVWHINYGNPELNGGGGWGIFNSILGWQNSATYGSVISYNVYWIVVIAMFLTMRFKESKGHLPFMKAKEVTEQSSSDSGDSESATGVFVNRNSVDNKTVSTTTAPATRTLSEE